jgi:c-di-GMP-binding flagellar brake protein YcgR
MVKLSSPRKLGGKERRRYPRQTVQLSIRFQSLKKNNISKAQSSQSQDLGAGGLAMISNQPLETDQLLLVTLFLPPASSKESSEAEKSGVDSATILSRVAWCQPTPNSDFYRLGIQFLDLTREDRKHLKKFLVDNKLVSKKPRLYV